MTLWVVKGGRSGEREERFLERGVVGIGWEDIPDLGKFASRDDLRQAYVETYPGGSTGKVGVHVGQLWAFSHVMAEGDLVVVPLKSRGQIAIGRIAGKYAHTLEMGVDMQHIRPVKWTRTDFPRATFDKDLLYSFGSFLGVSTVSRNNAQARVEAILAGKAIATQHPDPTGIDQTVAEELDLEQTARDQIVDFIPRRFKGHDLGRLVDAILRAQGFATCVSPPGPDGGVDILAGGGPMGLESPHLVVQVKSQQSQADVGVLRELKGTMGDYGADHGLLVCWGGFKDTLRREARTDFFKVRLWDQQELLGALFGEYERLDEDLRAELPLKRVWALALDAVEGS